MNFKILIDSIIGLILTPWRFKLLVHDILRFTSQFLVLYLKKKIENNPNNFYKYFFKKKL